MSFRLGVALACGTALLAQSKEPCLLKTASHGDSVKVRAEVFTTGHDTFIRPTHCEVSPDNRVILIWGDDPSLGVGKINIIRDSSFSEFNRLIKATHPLPPNGFGVGESRYRVVADFQGRLEIAASAGLKRDSKGKKIVGMEGFGHPMPFTRFRLVLTSVSRIEENEQKPKAQHGAERAAKTDAVKKP